MLGRHKINDIAPSEILSRFALKISPNQIPSHNRSNYRFLGEKKSLFTLENHLKSFQEQDLDEAFILLGTVSDPFTLENLPNSLKILELLKDYPPNLVVIQTRSPYIVLALPYLKNLNAATNMFIRFGIETPLDEVSRAYTPDLPTPSERIKAVRTINNFNIKTIGLIAPLMPYGDIQKDAQDFAALLSELFLKVDVQTLISSVLDIEKSGLVRKMKATRQYHYLRSDSARFLINALDSIAAERLREAEKIREDAAANHKICSQEIDDSKSANVA